MKLLKCSIIGLALLVLAIPIQAQVTVNTLVPGGTNNVAGATTNSYTTAFPFAVTRASKVTIQPAFKLTGAGTETIVFKFDTSVDNSTWKSAAASVSVTAAGTTTVNNIGTVTLDGAGFLRLSSIENPSASAVTNIVVKYSYKPGL